MGAIRLHWSASKNNFGDVLSPLIVEAVAGRPVVYASMARADLVAVGSLLQRLGERFWHRRVHVWGSGFIAPVAPHATRHHIHALRGPNTAAALRLSLAGLPMGDPGLLCGLLADRLTVQAGKYPLLVMAHYQDKGSAALQRFMALNPAARLVDIQAPPLETLSLIASSRLVVSSAMHGLITADGLGIPNVRIRFSDNLRGGDFKFQDYYGAYGMAPPREMPLVEVTGWLAEEYIANYARPGLSTIQEVLLNAFPRSL